MTAARLEAAGSRGRPFLRHVAAASEQVPQLRLGAWHGDLNPGNLAVTGAGAVVWDWERYEDGVPLGFDLLHHRLMSSITVRGEPAAGAARRLLDASPSLLHGRAPDASSALVTARLYLITIGARFLEDRQDVAGADLGRVEDWLLAVLDAS